MRMRKEDGGVGMSVIRGSGRGAMETLFLLIPPQASPEDDILRAPIQIGPENGQQHGRRLACSFDFATVCCGRSISKFH